MSLIMSFIRGPSINLKAIELEIRLTRVLRLIKSKRRNEKIVLYLSISFILYISYWYFMNKFILSF